MTSSPSATRPCMALHVSLGGCFPSWPKISSRRVTWSRVSERCSLKAFWSFSSDAADAIFGNACTSCFSASSRSPSCSTSTSSSDWRFTLTPFVEFLDARLLSAVATRKRAGVRALALRLHRVLRVARRLESGPEDRPAQAQLAGADHRPAERGGPPALRSPFREDEGAGAREPLRSPCELSRRSAVVDLAHLAEAELHRMHCDRLRCDAAQCEPAPRP